MKKVRNKRNLAIFAVFAAFVVLTGSSYAELPDSTSTEPQIQSWDVSGVMSGLFPGVTGVGGINPSHGILWDVELALERAHASVVLNPDNRALLIRQHNQERVEEANCVQSIYRTQALSAVKSEGGSAIWDGVTGRKSILGSGDNDTEWLRTVETQYAVGTTPVNVWSMTERTRVRQQLAGLVPTNPTGVVVMDDAGQVVSQYTISRNEVTGDVFLNRGLPVMPISVDAEAVSIGDLKNYYRIGGF